MTSVRRGLILIIAVLVGLFGFAYVFQVMPSAPLLGLIGIGVTVAVIGLAVRLYRGFD